MPLASTSAEPHASLQTNNPFPLSSSFLCLLANIHKSCLEITALPAPALLPPALARRQIAPRLRALTFSFWEQHAPLASHHLTLPHRQARGSPAGAARHPAPLPASSCLCQPGMAAAGVSSPPAPGRDACNCPVQSASKCQLGPCEGGAGIAGGTACTSLCCRDRGDVHSRLDDSPGGVSML